MACRLISMQLLCCSYLLLLLAGGSSVVNGFTQVTGSAMITSQCGVQQDDPQLVAALRRVEQLMVPQDATFPGTDLACRLLPSAPSGYYQIQGANNSYVQVYCDKEGTTWGKGMLNEGSLCQAGAACPQGLTQ